MPRSVRAIVESYDPDAPLAQASTIHADWYTDGRILDLERRTAFARAWQAVASVDQLRRPGDYVSSELSTGDPVVAVRGTDGALRAFYNVCRHHAAAIVSEPRGSASVFRCPYHGWTYALSGELKGTPDFAGVCDFDRAANGLVPMESGVWQKWVFVRVDRDGPSLAEFTGSDLSERFERLGVGAMHWMATRRFTLDCNWKVFVDNYLDGGYHVPHLHKGLDSVLDYSRYTIENGARFCLQWSPLVSEGAEAQTGAVRRGDRALYYWIYPNFMKIGRAHV